MRKVPILLAVLLLLAGCAGGDGGKTSDAGSAERDRAARGGGPAGAAEVDDLTVSLRDAVVEADVSLTRSARDLEATRQHLREWRQALADFDAGLREVDVADAAGDPHTRALEAVGVEIAGIDAELAETSLQALDTHRTVARANAHARATAINALRVALHLAPLGPAKKGDAEPASGETVFEDDFSDPASGFTAADTEEGTIGYRDGAYEVATKIPDRGFSSDTALEGDKARPELGDLGDVSVEVDVSKRGPVTALLGVACRQAAGGGAQYQGMFDTDGFWGIYRLTDPATTPHPIRESTPEDDASEYVAQGDGVNRVRLDCEGATGAPTTLTLYLNGQKLGEGTDEAGLPPGAVAMTLSSPEAAVVAAYDNLVIRRLG